MIELVNLLLSIRSKKLSLGCLLSENSNSPLPGGTCLKRGSEAVSLRGVSGGGERELRV